MSKNRIAEEAGRRAGELQKEGKGIAEICNVLNSEFAETFLVGHVRGASVVLMHPDDEADYVPPIEIIRSKYDERKTAGTANRA